MRIFFVFSSSSFRSSFMPFIYYASSAEVAMIVIRDRFFSCFFPNELTRWEEGAEKTEVICNTIIMFHE